jgi:pimeloyl-ACP methyl ester carboxylesterase
MREELVPIHDIEMHVRRLGRGQPLLLLHGFTGSGADWVHLFDLEALARDFDVIMPDLRGHGRSTNPAGTLTHAQCARDVRALCDRLGVGRFRALGVSLGGNTLLHLATQEPARVAAMVTFAAPSYFPAPARALQRGFTEESRSDDDWRSLRACHAHGDEQIRALLRIARGFADDVEDMCFTPPRLATIRARTLIVAGDRDPLYPLEIFVEQYRAIPRASLWIMPDAGHDAVFGAQRAAFAATARAFLAASDADANAEH